jgi:hypothetical protein
MSEPSTELVVPGSGALVDLDNPRQVAQTLDDVRDLERQLRSFKGLLTEAMVHASQIHGTKTMHLEGGITATVKGGDETVYDAEEIEAELRDAGMPEDRIAAIVRVAVIRTVSAVEAKRAASANPAYAEIIARHSRVQERPSTVTISRRG